MSVDRTFEAMRRIVEAPGYALLSHYKQDFYIIDWQYLERTYSAEAKYLWIVRECGTHLISLGVHPKMNEEAFAVFGTTSRMDIHVVEGCSVKRVSLQVAKDLLRQQRYRVDGHIVSGPRGPLASLRMEISPWSKGNRVGIAHYSSISSTAISNLADMIALVQVAECEAIKATQSLFTPTDLVWLDGEDLRSKLISLRAEPQGVLASTAAEIALCD